MPAADIASIRVVLVVHSTPDESTDRRIWKMQSRADVLGLRLHHITILTAEYASGPDPRMKPSEWIEENEDRIFARISALLDETSSGHLLLHTGVAFMIAPHAVLRVVSSLKSRYPSILFGIQQSRTLQLTIGESTPSIELDIQRLFDQGKDTQQLLEELFP